MLEALAALGLASNILSFVDFAIKMTNDASELARSADGLLNADRDLEIYTSKIHELSQSLERQHDSSPHSSQHVAAVQELATLSKITAEEILQHLRCLKAQDSRRWLTNLIHAFRMWRKSGQVDPGLAKLDRLQQGVQTHLLALLRFAESPLLFHLAYPEVPLIMTSRDEQSDLQWLIREAKDEGQKAMLEMKSSILEAIGSTSSSHHEDYQRLKDQLEILVKDGKDVATRLVLRSLGYEDMAARYSRIQKAHTDTFEWVFKRQDIHFGSWLESASTHGVFWISGKAGSGKSTLMRYLYEHQKTRDALHTWAGSQERLVIAGHFFWAAGTEKQKSQEGLLRSLLHHILRQRPAWIPLICPSHIKESFDFGVRDPWSLQELLTVFQKVLQLDSVDLGEGVLEANSICLFIDGLDEYSGEISEVIEIIQHAADSPHVKIIISSREWPVIDRAFHKDGKAMLRLQDLTKEDIRQYVEEKFRKCSQVSVLHEDQRFSRLKDDITTKAQGVFFWVFLVVRSLLEGLMNDDDISILEKRVAELPPDLESYFQRVLDDIAPAYRKDTARLLMTMLWAWKPLPLISLHMAMSHANDGNLKTYQGVNDGEFAEKMNESLKKQVHARCKDFLEIEVDPDFQENSFSRTRESQAHCQYRVDFLHLTVRDFLEETSMKSQLLEWVEGSFDPSICVCTCLRFWITTLPSSFFDVSDQSRRHTTAIYESMIDTIVHYFRDLEKARNTNLYDVVEEFNKYMKMRKRSPDEISLLASNTSLNNLQHDFLMWALSRGLTFYACRKVQLDPGSVTENNKQVLLRMAARPDERRDDRRTESIDELWIRIDLVRSLFEAGAQPEAKLGALRNWEPPRWRLLLKYLHYLRGAGVNINDGSQSTMWVEAYIDFTELLISYGADPKDEIPIRADREENHTAFVYVAHMVGYEEAQRIRTELWKTPKRLKTSSSIQNNCRSCRKSQPS